MILGYFDVQWKILEISTLQESGSETFSFDSVQRAMVRALFEQVRARIKESAQHGKGRSMSQIQLLFCPVSMFSDEIWRSLASNQQIWGSLTGQP